MKVSAKLAGWVVSGADTADRLSEFAKTNSGWVNVHPPPTLEDKKMDKATKERVRKMLKTTQGKWQAQHKQTGEVKYGRWSVLCDLEKRVWKLTQVEDTRIYMNGCTPATKRMMGETLGSQGLIWVDCAVDIGEIDEHTGKHVYDHEFYQQGIRHWSELSGFYIGGM